MSTCECLPSGAPRGSDVDHWKTWIHQRLSTGLDQPGAMRFFQAPPQEHLALAKHLTAEVKTEEFIPGKGVVTLWERIRRQNHWLDCLYNAAAAGSYCGVRLVEEHRKPKEYISLGDLARAAQERRIRPLSMRVQGR